MTPQTPVVRFAPSPTGLIHIGNARTAMINWLFAQKHDGRFILRFDDTDPERSREDYALAIEQDLRWLGIVPDDIVHQSRRRTLHDAAAEKLKSRGRLYPCYESAEELERKRRMQRARKLPPVYDRAALKLSEQERADLEAQGRRPHWRFLLEPGEVAWEDLVRGGQSIDMGSLSDPVLIREDGSYLYTLPSVVDDIEMGVTHVIRGEDHVTNTAVQAQIFEALGGAVPAFAHHSLLTAASGEGLSKRSGALSLTALREDGLEGRAVACFAATIGTSGPIDVFVTDRELVGHFDIAALSRAPARFDPDELAALNAKLVHQLGYDDVRLRLERLGVEGGEPFWLAVRDNLAKLEEAAHWWRVVDGEMAPPVQRPEWLDQAADLLPAEPWDDTVWKSWTGAIAATTGLKGKALFMPLRQALTGQDRGPELARLLPLIGREKALRRLGRSPL